MANLTNDYSGIFVNQNVTPTGIYPWRDNGGTWVYQTIAFPSAYIRGNSASEQNTPDISGFQIAVSIDDGYAESASLDYKIEYYDTPTWRTWSTGTFIGAHTDGDLVWFDVILDASVPVADTRLNKPWRIGVQTRTAVGETLNEPVTTLDTGVYLIDDVPYKADLVAGVPFPIFLGDGTPAYLLMQDLAVTWSVQQGISDLWYVSPSPLSQNPIVQAAFQADGVTPLLGADTNCALNFRALGLVADGGIDFLGNQYRSCVLQTGAGNIDTTSSSASPKGSTSGLYWMSPPQPSRFAVTSLYFDVRPSGIPPSFGNTNLVANPSFEYDAPGEPPAWWSETAPSGGTVVDFSVKSSLLPDTDPNFASWTAEGFQSMHLEWTADASDNFGASSVLVPIVPTQGGVPTQVSISSNLDLISLPTNAISSLACIFYDATETVIGTPDGIQLSFTSITGDQVLSGTFTVPATAAFVQFGFGCSTFGGATGTFEAYCDGIQATLTSQVEPYFDGDFENCQWVGQRGLSASVQLAEQSIQGNSSVIDGILVDPIVPNMTFNVYYSLDDANTSDNMTESDWEGKLWAHIPQVFTVNQKTQFMFPNPVQAKYIQVEFTNLQSQSYDPGPLAKPVSYKKFPSWVLNFFLAELTLPDFLAEQTLVVYDALDFAYNYFLDDLHSDPKTPVAFPSTALSQLTDYFTTAPIGVDPTTLSQIDLAMQPFQTSTSGDSQGGALDQLVSNIVNTPGYAGTSEGINIDPIDYSTVSSLQRMPIVLQQSWPIMYFFITCRHAYKELTANFDYNRAYFAGVNDIALLRNDYTIAADTPLYIESGGDTANTELTDFTTDLNGNWIIS